MPIESATHISDLVATNPVGASDNASDLDNHIRLVKSVLKTDFANISGAVTPTHTELNYLDGVTSAIQTQIDGKAAWTVTSTSGATLSGARIQVVVMSSSGGTLTLQASPTAGDIVVICNPSANTLAPNSGQTLNGGSNISMLATRIYFAVASSSTAWIVGRTTT